MALDDDGPPAATFGVRVGLRGLYARRIRISVDGIPGTAGGETPHVTHHHAATLAGEGDGAWRLDLRVNMAWGTAGHGRTEVEASLSVHAEVEADRPIPEEVVASAMGHAAMPDLIHVIATTARSNDPVRVPALPDMGEVLTATREARARAN